MEFVKIYGIYFSLVVMFVYHSNICRSIMAEFVMKNLVRKAVLIYKFIINSSAISCEKIGCDIHYGIKVKSILYIKEKDWING